MELPPGYTLRRRPRNGHWVIIRPDGEVLRQANGLPMHVCFSPSDYRTRKNEMAKVKKAISNLESQVRSNDE